MKYGHKGNSNFGLFLDRAQKGLSNEIVLQYDGRRIWALLIFQRLVPSIIWPARYH